MDEDTQLHRSRTRHGGRYAGRSSDERWPQPQAVIVSIVMPVLNEAPDITAALGELQALRTDGVELIVVDGGSDDATATLAAPLADRVVRSDRGRGRQMNAGAAVADGEILLFLHADTRLPADAVRAVRDAMRRGATWGRFDVDIFGRLRGLALVARMMNLRSRWSGIATGDQAIFCTRQAFAAVGGFAEIALMEDIVFSRRMRAVAWPACLPLTVATSGRRWERHGLVRTILTMWWLRLRFRLGARPEDLARLYGYRTDERS